MKDRRQFERYPLTLHVRIETIGIGKKHVFEFETKDISAAGVFILTSKKFPQGSMLKLNITISNDKIKELTGGRGLMECEGDIVRSTHTGVAIRFNGDCQVLSKRACDILVFPTLIKNNRGGT
jgi:hypothetical protein